MFNVDLKKELDELVDKKETQLNSDMVITNTMKLLEEGAADDRRILNLIAPKSTEMQVIEQQGKALELKALKEDNGQYPIYDTEEIKSIAIRYRMRFLSSRTYIGQIPPTVIHDFKDYLKKSNKTSNDEYDRLFILAPKNLFSLKEKEVIPPPRMIRYDPEPILFYKLRKDEDKYVMISKWGKDFTVFRRIRGFLTQKRYGKTMWCIFALLGVVHYFTLNKFMLYELTNHKDNMTLDSFVFATILVSLLLVGISALLSGIAFRFDEAREESEKCWDKDYKTAF